MKTKPLAFSFLEKKEFKVCVDMTVRLKIFIQSFSINFSLFYERNPLDFTNFGKLESIKSH